MTREQEIRRLMKALENEPKLPYDNNWYRRFALIQFGGGVIQMSGSIAGNTFAKNRYGNYVRARTHPVNPNTERQGNIRNTMSALAEAWNDTLNAAQRAAWNLYASNVSMTNKLGQSINLSGFNHFVRSNSIRLFAGPASQINPGPTTFNLPIVDPTLSVTCQNDNTIDIAYDDTMDWCDLDNAQMMLFMGAPQNPGKGFFNGPWRYAWRAVGSIGAPPSSPSEGNSPPFTITPGQSVWFYARISLDDGRLSNKFFDGPKTVQA